MRLWLAMGVGAVLVISSGVISSIVRAQPSADPAAVITAYEMARNRQDVEGALTYFADNAMITQRNTTFSGKDEIRTYLNTMVARARFIVVSDRHVSGNIVTWTERSSSQLGQTARLPGYGGAATTTGVPNAGRSGANQGPTAVAAQAGGFAITVEAVVQDGKIQSLAYVFGGPSPRSDPALQGRAELPAGIGLAAVLAVLVGIVLVASMGLGRATPVNSSLRGRLLQDLQGWAAARQ